MLGARRLPSACVRPACLALVCVRARASTQFCQLLSLLELEPVLVARAAGVQTAHCWPVPLGIAIRSGGLLQFTCCDVITTVGGVVATVVCLYVILSLCERGWRPTPSTSSSSATATGGGTGSGTPWGLAALVSVMRSQQLPGAAVCTVAC